MKHTSAILDFAAAPHVLPPQVRSDTLRLLADTLAVGAAGAASLEGQRLSSTLGRWSRGDKARTLEDDRESALAASFFNGFVIHCLEWDAVHEGAVVHALSVVTSALLEASDRYGRREPEEFLVALAVGVDIASGLGISATGPMRFFRPATAGVVGAALAVARLAKIPRDKMADVLGLAYSFAGGTMQAHVEASTALPLQIAKAAQASLQSIDLVWSGFDGPHDVLEGPFGYSALIEPLDLSRYTTDLGDKWRISEVSVKPFPSGRASHGALGVLQELRRQGTVSLETVESIELFAPPLIHRLVGRPFEPEAPMSYNRLCLAFLVPLMLRDGHIDPRYSETIAPLARKVTVTLDDNHDGNALLPQKLMVRLKDGSTIERQIDDNLGSPEAPMSAAQYAAKYDLCRALAPNCDSRIFDDPLAYATDPK
ncbi:MAG: MmgE/PrpD family protein [Sphingorhabdus sp.]